ncbi:MAG: hypothetical protein U0174_06065 [Polyangiaceae bacterium]
MRTMKLDTVRAKLVFVVGGAVLSCGDGTVRIVDGSTPEPSARSFPMCDPKSDFGGEKQLPGLEAVPSFGFDFDYWIDATLTDDEAHIYFSACATSRSRACMLMHATFDESGAATNLSPTGTESSKSIRHPTISADRSTIVWVEDAGRANRVFIAARDGRSSYDNDFSERREVLVLPKEENLRYADPYIGRDRRLYLMLGPSSGTSTLHSVAMGSLGDTANTKVVDATLTGTNPVADGGPSMFMGRYDANTGLRSIVSSERDASGKFAAPSPKYVASLNAPGTSNYPTWVSKDGCRLYFTRGNKDDITSYRVWMASRKAKP